MPKAKTKKRIAPINPREPLTKKARSAIKLYAFIKTEGTNNFPDAMIDHILKAERMKRELLYALLASYGYRWQTPNFIIVDINGLKRAGYCPARLRPKKGKLS